MKLLVVIAIALCATTAHGADCPTGSDNVAVAAECTCDRGVLSDETCTVGEFCHSDTTGCWNYPQARDTCEADLQKTYIGVIKGFSYTGVFMCIAAIVLGSLGPCCAKMVEKRKIFGVAAILLSIFGFIFPAIGAMAGSNSTVEKACKCYEDNGATCTDEEKKDIKAVLSGFGIIIAYLGAFGWLAIILGIVGISMGGASCCGCCKAKDEGAAGAVATGTVVG